MYHKLALRNIRRSVKDYAIYFVTLLLGVALFYAFNSIGSQQILFDLESTADEHQFETTQQLLSMFSGVIAFVLAFLILYSNRFLIRRRKKEFGTYLLLGMTPAHVSSIVLYETVIVGLVSLVVGLVIGVMLSQALSFFTASLLDTTLTNYQFVFSFDGFLATLICFAVIYVVVAVFNIISVARCKLIDLLQADKKNERTGVRNPWICLVVFIISIAVLAYAYEQLIENGLVMLDDPQFIRATVGMLVGTLLFFWSLAGFVIAVITRLRGVYLRGLRVFTVRQISSKVNTAFLSLWAVCVLLFFSITVFSTGMGMIEVFVGGVEAANPYSATLRGDIWYGPDGSRASSAGLEQRASEMREYAPERFAQAESYDWNMARPLQEAAPDLWTSTIAGYAQIDAFDDPTEGYGDLFDALLKKGLISPSDISQLEGATYSHLSLVSLSDFNAAMELQGKGVIELNSDQCALVNNLDMTDTIAKALLKSGMSIDVSGKQYAISDKLYDAQLEDNAMKASILTFVVPDAAIEGLWKSGYIPSLSYLNVMYADNGLSVEENDIALGQIIEAAQPADMGGFDRGYQGSAEGYASLLWPVTTTITANDMISQSAGLRFMITYLAIYIGFIFLISTAAILAIQQLSQASDSSPRYRTLWSLGCDRRMIFRSLLAQIAVYFMIPLGLAVCHSACAIGVISKSLFESMGTSPAVPIAMAAVLTIVIYGTYMLLTYFASRGIVKGAIAPAA